jgi:RNA polymerase sigma-70 factor (ECF subfamily)
VSSFLKAQSPRKTCSGPPGCRIALLVAPGHIDSEASEPERVEPIQRPTPDDVTALLRVWSTGDEQAFDRLIPLVYDELHRMALRYLAGERSNVSLQATALVNEVCLRLLGWDQARWQNRSHFFGVSAQMMRRVLVDIARRRRARRRGGPDVVRVPIESVDVAGREPDMDLTAVDRALERLAAGDPRKARVVELRFFGGLSMEETAKALGISVRTAQGDWAFARAWLYRELLDEARL